MDYLTRDLSPDVEDEIIYKTKDNRIGAGSTKEGKGDVKRVSFDEDQIASFLDARGIKIPKVRRPEQRMTSFKTEKPIGSNRIQFLPQEKPNFFGRQQAGDYDYGERRYSGYEVSDGGEGLRSEESDVIDDPEDIDDLDNKGMEDEDDGDFDEEEEHDDNFIEREARKDDNSLGDDGQEDEDEAGGDGEEGYEDEEGEGDEEGGEGDGGEDDPGVEVVTGGNAGSDSLKDFRDVLKLISRLSVFVYAILYLLSYVFSKK